MKRIDPFVSSVSIFVEALEPRIAPAGLLNEAKFTTITLGTPQLLDASGGPNSFQGLTTGSGPNGQYLLYITSGKALVFTSDLAGNGKYEPGDITGIAAGVDGNGQPLNLILFTDVHGDIVTDLLPGKGVSQLSDSDNNPANGRDGRVLLDDGIGSITIRTLTSADINTSIPGNTLENRLALTHFSIYGNIYSGGDFGGLTIDTSGSGMLANKFNGGTGDELFTTADPTIGDIYTGTAASYQPFHFTQLSGTAAFQGTFLPFTPPAGQHGGDISNISAVSNALFNIGTIETGNGGTGARGGNISDVTLQVDGGGYQLIAGDGGEGAVGGVGGSIINFSDVGSITGEVLLHTGSGGIGLLGVGGAGGTATFGTVNIAAGVDVILGHGGNGFTGGGQGAGLPSAIFTVPEGVIPAGSQFEGTYHAIGDVGNTFQLGNGTYSPQVIDFNGDGFGDGVFATNNPDQLVIVFGNGVDSLVDSQGNPNSSLPSETIRLNVPGPITSFVVADFNGDGKPDIAVASADPGNSGGVEVFLNQIGNSLLNPLGSANFSKNPLGAHPFSTPLQSALPTLTDFGFFASTGGILALAAGDFNGDGIMDLGYVEQVHLIAPIATPPNPVYEAVGVLFGSAARNSSGAEVINPTTGHIEGSGYFYANPSAQTAAPTLQVAFFEFQGVPVLKATSLTSTNVNTATGVPTAPEVLVYGERGVDGNTGTTAVTGGVGALSLLSVDPSFAGLNTSVLNLGTVDTNRKPGALNVSLTDVSLETFAITDVNDDGNADIVVLSSQPLEFLVVLKGDGAGDFVIKTGTGVDQAGLTIGSSPGNALAPISLTNSGVFNDVGVLQFGMVDSVIAVYQLGDGTSITTSAGLTPVSTDFVDNQVGNQMIAALDTFYERVETAANPNPTAGFGVLTPNSTIIGDSFLEIIPVAGQGVTFLLYETNNGFRIYSGDGGDSTIGAGGNAGVLGNGTLSVDTLGNPAGSVSIVFPANAAYEGNSFLSGGHGGSGFTSGGLGGDVTGVSATYVSAATVLSSTIQLSAGNGGNAISGSGGRGGFLSEFSLVDGTFFSAGNGGTGLTGGAGGAITGNNQGIFDTNSPEVTVVSGSGGIGATGGGAGGDITSFDAVFPAIIGGVGGSLSYITGSGGSAAGGVGGNAGNITDSSPDATENNLAGDITLSTGTGGSGLTGGSGGAITNFVNSPTGESIPTRLNVLTGAGGIGISSTGGDGGSITNLQADATGLANGSFSALSGIVRVLAGNGGASYATTGGAGGSIIDTTVEATSTPIAVVAGAGGDGPLVGGAGGAVLDSVISSAAQQFGKMLIIAGDGGDATAVTKASVTIPGDSNTNDLQHALLAFGGANGVGGNGGDITNLTQPTGSETAVDLIAGNGGSTINSGGPLQTITGVGMGGSVTGVNLAGTVGSIARQPAPITYPPIVSYTDTDGLPSGADTVKTGADDVSLATFVATFLGGSVSLAQTSDINHSFTATNPAFMLDDAAGNVGIVAGRAGFVKGGQAARDGLNGSVEDIVASSYMSIVAGSVNNVAPVQVLSGITISNSDGVLGADKSPNGGGPNGVLDYFNHTVGADLNSFAAGDRLIDGAVYAITIDQPPAPPTLTGARVFSPNNG